jgi:hypothetical protein
VRSALLLVPAVLGLLACNGDNSDAFLPFADLCPVYAEQVCAAIPACCDVPEDPECEARMVESCDQERLALAEVDGLTYDGVHAQDVRDAQAVALEKCEPASAISRYFSGGAKDGSACTEPTECESQACNDGKCSNIEVVLLCPVPSE